jgi:hypothetical protein
MKQNFMITNNYRSETILPCTTLPVAAARPALKPKATQIGRLSVTAPIPKTGNVKRIEALT